MYNQNSGSLCGIIIRQVGCLSDIILGFEACKLGSSPEELISDSQDFLLPKTTSSGIRKFMVDLQMADGT